MTLSRTPSLRAWSYSAPRARADRMRVARNRAGQQAVAILAVVASLAACAPAHEGATSNTTSEGATTSSWSDSSHAAGAALAAGLFSVRIEPGAGYGWYVAQLGAARRSVDLWMYELTDQDVIGALVAAHDRGVGVRVILDAAFYGKVVNQGAYDRLRGAGLAVQWAPVKYIFHIKATIIDGSVLDVGTGNLVPKYYADDRDAIVVDRDPAQVRAASATFAADWAGGPPSAHTVGAPGLVWSPGATSAMVAFIASARHSVDFSSEELADKALITALAAAARRGVACRVVMTADTAWDAAFATLQGSGCAVHVLPNRAGSTYVHVKWVLDDTGTPSARSLVGSQNASPTSLNRNRELSVILPTTATAAIATEAATFTTDYNAGAPFLRR